MPQNLSVALVRASFLQLLILLGLFCAAQHGHDSKVGDSSLRPVDILTIEKIIGLKPFTNKGECIVSVPQNDLNVEVSGFRIIPPMGLGTSVGFTSSSNGVMIMGDLVLTEIDIKPVQQEVIKQGLTITAVHNHFVGNIPNVVWMHVGGSGTTEEMAKKVRLILDKIKETRGHNPSEATYPSVTNTIDTTALVSIIGSPGRMTNKGVYRQAIDRKGIQVKEHGVAITTFIALGTWFAWQGTPEKAAVAGEYTLLENEVEPVVKALVENGIDVVALHSHMVHEEPRVFFLHCWGVGPAEKLAKGLKAALNQLKQ